MKPGMKSLGRQFKYSMKSALILLALFLVIVVLSLVYRHQSGPSFWVVIVSALLLHRWAAAFLVVAYFAGYVSYVVYSKGFRELTNHLWIPLKEPGFYVLLVFVLAAAGGFWILSAMFSAQPPPNQSGLSFLMQHDPGGLFAAFMAVLTVVGFALTLQGLWEIRRTITSFSDLIFRLSKMLKSVKEGQTVRMLCYTPSLGYIALEEREFNGFANLVTEKLLNDKPRAELICLSKQALEDWHNLFIGRQTRRKRIDPEDTHSGEPVLSKKPGEVTPIVATAASRRAERIASRLNESDNDCASSVKRLPLEFMPGYYFFFTDERAILVAPLYLPFPTGTPKAIQKRLPPVADMIGFETNDKAMISDLQQLFDFYQRLPSNFVAETTERISARDFEAWIKGKRVGELTDKLIEQFNMARGRTPNHEPTEDDKARSNDYAEYLREDAWLPDTRLEVLFRVMLAEEAPEWKRKPESPTSKKS